jgi:chemotaxis protein MotB
MNSQKPSPNNALNDQVTQSIQSEIELAEKKGVFSRPWHEGWEEDAHLIEDDQSFWLLTMVDLMTLLLTMFVLLAAYAYQSKDNTVTMVASSGSTQQAQKVDKTPTPQTGPMPTTQTSPGETPTQGNIPQAGNALIGKAGETALDRAKPSAESSSADDKTSQDQARALFAGLGKDVDVSVVKGRINLRVKDNILFSSGNSALSAAGMQLLKRLADRLKAGDYPIAVQGHTDNVPIHTLQFPSNWELSAARAAAVVQELIASGVQPNRLSAIGFADTHPITSNDTASGRAENRRVDLELQLPASMLPKVIAGTNPASPRQPASQP